MAGRKFWILWKDGMVVPPINREEVTVQDVVAPIEGAMRVLRSATDLHSEQEAPGRGRAEPTGDVLCVD